jgi:hypothetical protein
VLRGRYSRFSGVLLLCAAHQIVAFDFGFSDRSFSATLCEKDNPETTLAKQARRLPKQARRP